LAPHVQVNTKFVPDLSSLATMTGRDVEAIIDRSLLRLGMEQLDNVQFHWWDFSQPRYVEIALELDRLRRAGKIGRIGVTNFDVAHLREICAAGVKVVTHQVQYSLLDDRPNHGMVAFCRDHDIGLLCYGTVAGGFLSERWLGRDEPCGGITNRSLIKYKLIIDDFGGWDMFQRLLAALHAVAARHGTDIATVASRAILERDQVAAVIVGATSVAHLAAHEQIGSMKLREEDCAAIEAVTRLRSGPDGDVYVLERDRTGRHGSIMKYELNKLPEKVGNTC